MERKLKRSAPEKNDPCDECRRPGTSCEGCKHLEEEMERARKQWGVKEG
jgi:hypothetical protein